MPRKLILPLLLSGAALTALTLIFPRIGFLEWFSLIPVFLALFCLSNEGRIGYGRAFLYGAVTFFTYNLIVYIWFLRLYPLDFAGLTDAESVPVVLLGWFALALIPALFGGGVFLCYAVLHRTGIFRRIPILQPLVLSVLWMIAEWFSTLGGILIPWGRLCLGQTEYLPLLQSASLFGFCFVGFLILAFNGLLAYAIVSARKSARKSVACFSAAVILFLSNAVFGFCTVDAVNETESASVRVAALRTEVGVRDKWNSENLSDTMDLYDGLIRDAASDGAELVILPETALPYVLNQNRYLSDFMADTAQKYGVTVIFGALHRDSYGKMRNALYMITPDGAYSETVYFKRRLVPFGEYIPAEDLLLPLLPQLETINENGGNLTAGKDTALFETEWGKVGSLICFDSVYEELTFDSVRDGAGLLLISTNDAWFADSSAVRQHTAQAKLRAIECGRTVVRSANAGDTVVIDEHGRVTADASDADNGYALRNVSFRSGKTLFTRIGDLFVYLCIAAYLSLLTVGIVLRFRQRKIP